MEDIGSRICFNNHYWCSCWGVFAKKESNRKTDIEVIYRRVMSSE